MAWLPSEFSMSFLRGKLRAMFRATHIHPSPVKVWIPQKIMQSLLKVSAVSMEGSLRRSEVFPRTGRGVSKKANCVVASVEELSIRTHGQQQPSRQDPHGEQSHRLFCHSWFWTF